MFAVMKQTNEGIVVPFGDQCLPDRFWNKIERPIGTGCWLWTAHVNSSGYGIFWTGGRGGGVRQVAHRYAFVQAWGDPGILHLDHLCRVRRCVNLDHVEAVTARTNILRGVGAGATNARKTRCKRGHEFDRMSCGKRRCSQCMRLLGIIA